MPALVTVVDVRRRVQTDLSDSDLLSVIADEEAEIVSRLGAHGDGTTSVTEIYDAPAGGDLFLRRKAQSITSITVTYAGNTTPTTVSATGYVVRGAGRISHLAGGWGDGIVTVTYIPADDRARRRQVIVELVRLALEQTALRAESVAGEYSYTAPESWEAARAKLYRRLTYMSI